MLLRPLASRSTQLGSLQRRSAEHQKRHKTFVAQVDEDGDSYYVLANREERRKGGQPRLEKLFEMPNVLLDLDAEGAKNVRSCSDEDEQHWEAKWAFDSRRQAVKERVKNLKSEVYESRHKRYAIESQRMNTWRITPHDILSAAVRGAPRETESPRLNASGWSDWGELNSSKASLISHALRVENGIPDHALSEDTLLIRWMKLRHEQLQRSNHYSNKHPPKVEDVIRALKWQTSIGSIRRLVFQCLDAGLNITDFSGGVDGPKSFARTLRKQCLLVLGQSESPDATRVDILTFLGNLSQRLKLGPALDGLALKLSADTAVIGATFEYFQKVVSPDRLVRSPEASEDILSAMTRYEFLLQEGQTKSLQATSGRQLLFQTLTGLEEDHLLNPISIRSFALQGGEPRPNNDLAQQMFPLYTQYITLLGHLGAMRTLWKEWRLSAPVFREAVQQGTSMPELIDVATVFSSALETAILVGAIQEEQAQPNLDLAECATLDYHSMEKQNVENWIGPRDLSTTQDLPSSQNMRLAMDLPLDGFLGVCRGR